MLPYISDIISVAAPVFTRRKGNTEESRLQILQQQVSELQAASLQNVGDIKALAEQLKTALPLLEQEMRQEALQAGAKSRRAGVLCGLALGLSALALVVAFTALLSK
ncbi:chemotaxis protein [Collimonas sp. H4R21]|uniref:Chemotaxis protein n=1 Tax=Collimonas rhizosphaerae TaxID=3126357 RepID=A0ABU9PRY1_9BURK